MRLFIGVFPPKEVLDQLRDIIREFDKQKRNLKVPPIDQMHVTLKYIGARVSSESEYILRKELVKHNGNYGKFKVNFTGAQFGFSFDRNPRILMANIENSSDLIASANSFHYAVKSLELEDTIRIKGKYSNDFHITLARLKDSASRNIGARVKKIAKELEISIPPFEATEAYLVESIIPPNKQPKYRRIERIIL